jgi:hypothetical protein
MTSIKVYNQKGFKNGHPYEVLTPNTNPVIKLGKRRRPITLEFLRKHDCEITETDTPEAINGM